MKAFEVTVDGKTVNYRVGQPLDLGKIRKFLEKNYVVEKLWQGGRHVLANLRQLDKSFFFKLATTEGISAVTKIEYTWNDAYNKRNSREYSPFWVPQNVTSGLFEEKLFYFVTDKFEGNLLIEKPEKSDVTRLDEQLLNIITFAEHIQELPIVIPEKNHDAQSFFKEKTHAWFDAIPEDTRKMYDVSKLLVLVDQTYQMLEQKTRHGDFTPWHIFTLNNNKLGLIDGEHATGSGVMYYDLAYCIQRVFSVLENPDLAEKILSLLQKRNYNFPKLQTVLAARALGGFLDESLKENPNYLLHDAFKDFVFSLTNIKA